MASGPGWQYVLNDNTIQKNSKISFFEAEIVFNERKEIRTFVPLKEDEIHQNVVGLHQGQNVKKNTQNQII